MKIVWCWRCKAEMPMLEEDEFKLVTKARLPVTKGRSLKECLAPVVAEYERITGFKETNPNAVYHHRLTLYGPPCSACGKPLRTPQAKVCGACMKPVTRP